MNETKIFHVISIFVNAPEDYCFAVTTAFSDISPEHVLAVKQDALWCQLLAVVFVKNIDIISTLSPMIFVKDAILLSQNPRSPFKKK
ncbi:hypothetical protein AVEN_123446-1 [Araneus ventricosus]|uniref:Uncharacterized protein n=1 Tax=Araneus ventricosus TaxID=182803 RepID=A0A4Y2QYG6_ARAVE|nr:hypothetical protein AVEN_123446-1 [Araneus ventricosus]